MVRLSALRWRLHEISDITLATMQNILTIRHLAVATVVARVARDTVLLPLLNVLIVST